MAKLETHRPKVEILEPLKREALLVSGFLNKFSAGTGAWCTSVCESVSEDILELLKNTHNALAEMKAELPLLGKAARWVFYLLSPGLVLWALAALLKAWPS